MKRARDTVAARLALREAMQRGEVDLRQALRTARRIMGLSQTRYAELVGVAPRALMDFERGVGNPTLHTLERLGRPFGFRVSYLPEAESE